MFTLAGMYPRIVLLLVALLFITPAPVRADEASHRKSVETLLGLMNMESLLNQSIDQMMQIQVQQNPQIAPHQKEMKAFLSKYMSWETLKEDMVKLYMAEFTEAELKELIAFYQTPVGIKTIERMPTLMAKGAQLGQKRVQEHLPELQATIQAKGAPAAASSPTKKTP